MNANAKQTSDWGEWLSPLKITLLAINAVCFGACIVLLVFGAGGGPLVLLTIATGLSFGSGLTGAIVASRRNTVRQNRSDGTAEQNE